MSDFGDQIAELLRSSTEQALSSELVRMMAAQSSQAAASQSAAKETQSAGSAVANGLLGGMGLSPLLRGLLSLFGGGDEEPAPALAKYAAPSAVRLDAGVSRNSNSPVAVDYGQDGTVREVATAAPQVVVNVSAMDTQSFLDRSDDIAQAVRRALLESHSLNDVIAEL
jgi:hypothetical protein